VSQILHYTLIEVDEVRTNAAAVTRVDNLWLASVRPAETVHVQEDHAFAYVIRNHVTGTILFTGTSLNPNDENLPDSGTLNE
jgi:serine protease inhibitor